MNQATDNEDGSPK